MINNEFANSFNSHFDIKQNHSKIIEKINNHDKKEKYAKIISIACLCITILAGTSNNLYAKRKWDIEYKNFSKRPIVKTETTLLESNNYSINTSNIDYIYHNNIGIKIDSISLTRDYLKLKININIENFQNIDSEKIKFGYAIYDENHNLYGVSDRLSYSNKKEPYLKKLSKELNLKYNQSKSTPTILETSSSQEIIYSNNGNIISELNLSSYKNFPNSEKLHIRIFDLGFSLVEWKEPTDEILTIAESEDFKLSDYEWQFTLNLPESFKNKTSIPVTFSEEIDGFQLQKAILSETALTIELYHNFGIINSIPEKISISDDKGNIYYLGTGKSDDNLIQTLINITPETFKNKVFITFDIPEHNIYKKVELLLSK